MPLRRKKINWSKNSKIKLRKTNPKLNRNLLKELKQIMPLLLSKRRKRSTINIIR